MTKAKEKSLYEVLAVAEDAPQAEIKKAYLKLALKLHPDKNPGDEEAQSKFQSLQRIYAVLSDPERRKVYDQTGSLEDSEELAGEEFESLYQYYRSVYNKVSEEDIEHVEGEYRGSQEEKADLLKYYTQVKGDMKKVFEWVMCSDPERDSHRFMDAVEEAIEKKQVTRFKKFTSWEKEVNKKPRPENPLDPLPRDSKEASSEQALIAAIRNKSSLNIEALAASMEMKYGKGKSGKSAKRRAEAVQEPSEAEFAAAAARLEAKRQKTSGPEAATMQPSGEWKTAAHQAPGKAKSKKKKRA